MKRPTRRHTTATLLIGAVLVTLPLVGCSERSPVQSIVPYTPSDGVEANLSSLGVRNLLVVSAGKGQPGVLSGALVNSGGSDVQVTFTAAGDTATATPVSVPPGQVIQLGDGAGQVHVQLATVSVAPGALLPMQVATPASGPSLVDVPVLDPSLEYATITPTPVPTDTPSTSPTDAGTPSVSPTTS